MPLNLEQHRSGVNVWENGPVSTMTWDYERWAAALAAGALLISAGRRRSALGLAMAAGGGALAWWAASTLGNRTHRRDWMASLLPHARNGWGEDPVLEASEESFPASDAPCWTPTTGNVQTPDTSNQHSH